MVPSLQTGAGCCSGALCSQRLVFCRYRDPFWIHSVFVLPAAENETATVANGWL